MARSRPLCQSQGMPPMTLWPRFDPAGLSAAHRAQFQRNRLAAQLYLGGASAARIREAANMDLSHVRRMVARCLRSAADGRIAGEAGLVPWLRLAAPCRRKRLPEGDADTGYAGAFSLLLRQHPSLEQAMQAVLQSGTRLRAGKGAHSSQAVHAAFLEACAVLGLDKTDAYPFNTHSLAAKSVAAYVRRYVVQHLPAVAEPLLGRAAAAKLRTGDGRRRPPLAVFELVECDAHLLDHALNVMVRHPEGHYVPRKLRRLWVVALVEVRSRAVLGYSLSLARQPCAQDLLDALHMALSPWQRYQRFWPDWSYSEMAGFPSQIPGLRGMGFRQLSVDGARMNLGKEVAAHLERLMDAQVLYLGRGTPDERPYIERFFMSLEELGFHRLRGTTGSQPRDPRRLPEIDRFTGRHRLDWQHVPAILDHVIAEYNGAPHAGLGDVSRLSFLSR